jgi:hypothetical protein
MHLSFPDNADMGELIRPDGRLSLHRMYRIAGPFNRRN